MEEGEEESHFQTFLLHHIHQIQQHQLQQPPLLAASPKKQKTAAATRQIVPVPGGHIVRSTGQKDRHSKVCTAKGLRDRRVRLSAHTAIEFYDVQDRLGYDRPSMAVDWLIKNSKNAIDELDHLPPWQPTATSSVGFQEIADPITNSGSIDPFPPDPLSRTRSHAQDLQLSLQSFQKSNNNNMFSFDASSAMADTGGGSGYLDRQFFTQRGPLQSSTPPSVPPWMDPVHSPTPFHHPSSSLSVPDIDFGSGSGGGFSGFRIPSWIHDTEEHNKPGSNSHH